MEQHLHVMEMHKRRLVMRQIMCVNVDQVPHATPLKPVNQNHACVELLQDVRRVKPATQTRIRVHNSSKPIQIPIYRDLEALSKIKK